MNLQLARDHLVHLFERYCLPPERTSGVFWCHPQVYLSVRRRGSYAGQRNFGSYLMLYQHGMGDLKKLAFAAITAHSTQLESSRLMEEAFSVFTSRQDLPTMEITARLLTCYICT